MTIPLQFVSFYARQEILMWSNCLLDLGTDFLVGNMVSVKMMAVRHFFYSQPKGNPKQDL